MRVRPASLSALSGLVIALSIATAANSQDALANASCKDWSDARERMHIYPDDLSKTVRKNTLSGQMDGYIRGFANALALTTNETTLSREYNKKNFETALMWICAGSDTNLLNAVNQVAADFPKLMQEIPAPLFE